MILTLKIHDFNSRKAPVRSRPQYSVIPSIEHHEASTSSRSWMQSLSWTMCLGLTTAFFIFTSTTSAESARLCSFKQTSQVLVRSRYQGHCTQRSWCQLQQPQTYLSWTHSLNLKCEPVCPCLSFTTSLLPGRNFRMEIQEGRLAQRKNLVAWQDLLRMQQGSSAREPTVFLATIPATSGDLPKLLVICGGSFAGYAIRSKNGVHLIVKQVCRWNLRMSMAAAQ